MLKLEKILIDGCKNVISKYVFLKAWMSYQLVSCEDCSIALTLHDALISQQNK